MSRRFQGSAARVPRWAAAALLLAVTGCAFSFLGDRDVDEEVLDGRWELTGDAVDDDVSDFFIELDDDGEITGISYRLGSVIVELDGDAIDSKSQVEGDSVVIDAEWLRVNSLRFEGRLSADLNRIDGSLTYRFEFGAITLGVVAGAATLTRQ
jgi:hypothetical protein